MTNLSSDVAFTEWLASLDPRRVLENHRHQMLGVPGPYPDARTPRRRRMTFLTPRQAEITRELRKTKGQAA